MKKKQEEKKTYVQMNQTQILQEPTLKLITLMILKGIKANSQHKL